MREGGSQTWLDTFSLLTECTAEKFCNTTGVFRHLANWSNSYLNFQMGEEVEVEVRITKLSGDPVRKAVVRPEAAAARCEVREGEVYLSLALWMEDRCSWAILTSNSSSPGRNQVIFIMLTRQG